MSYGYEYGSGFGGGFDTGYGAGGGGFGGFGDIGGGFMGADDGKPKSTEKKSRDKQSFIPVSVKQLLTATLVDDTYRVDDAELNIVKLVGTLLYPQEHSTNFTFKLNDGSGTIDCKHWIEKDGGSGFSHLKALREGVTVRVVGNLREYEGTVHVLVYSVTILQDWNELTYHILDVIYTHLQNTRGAIPGTGAASSAAPGFSPMGGMAPRGGMMGGVNLQQGNVKKETKLEETVFRAYLSGGSRQEGLKYDEVLRILKGQGLNLSYDQLVKTVDQLCNDGRLYTTIDEEHYRPTTDEW